MNSTNRAFLLMLMATLLNGCSRPDTDVTSVPDYNFQKFAGTVWKTKVKVALADIKEYTGDHHIYLLTPDAFDPKHPNYRRPPYMEKVIQELPVGTRFQVARLIKDNGSGSQIWVTISLQGVAADSVESGTTVYLSRFFLSRNKFLFQGTSDSKDWIVDPDMLEKAD
jgi:hypothetical protein